MPDDVIQELWRIKDAMARKHRHSLDSLFDDLLCRQAANQAGQPIRGGGVRRAKKTGRTSPRLGPTTRHAAK